MGSAQLSSILCLKSIQRPGIADKMVQQTEWWEAGFSSPVMTCRPKRGHDWRQCYKRTMTAQLLVPKEFKWEQVLWMVQDRGDYRMKKEIWGMLLGGGSLGHRVQSGHTCELWYRKSKHFCIEKKIFRFHYNTDWSPFVRGINCSQAEQHTLEPLSTMIISTQSENIQGICSRASASSFEVGQLKSTVGLWSSLPSM